MAKNQGSFRNALLSRLPAEQQESVARHLQPVQFEMKQVIYDPGKLIEHVYFLESGMISVVSHMEDGKSIEVGTIGSDGIVGGGLLLGANVSPTQYYVQIVGNGYRMSAEALAEESAKNNELRELILRFQAAFLVQLMQGVACNGLHGVQQRCCRWLLTARDRSESDELSLTHEFLALMLGVRRASVSEVLQPLQERGWVRSNRGAIAILDRKGLESDSCECYRVITEQYNRLLK